MPYIQLTVGGRSGYFLIDHGTNSSFIDSTGFAGGRPQPVSLQQPGTYSWAGFPLSWSTVNLWPNDYSGLQGLPARQAGLLGTDILANRAFTLAYSDSSVFAADSLTLCSDSTLRREGFSPVWTLGYFPTDVGSINPQFPRVPTVPIRIGNVASLAQLDPGYDDSLVRHSVNINQALFRVLEAAGVSLIRMGSQQLTTCGTTETVTTYRLGQGTRFEIIGTDNQAAVMDSSAVLHVKQTPAAARRCGGIGTWSMPAAQIGASFFVDAGRVVFDPYSQRVWFRTSSP